MTDLVIGGAGFVGRNLTRRLVDEGREVVVLDRNPGLADALGSRFVEGNAEDAEGLRELVREVRPEVLYHLAANSDISAGVADARLDFGDTLMTTLAIRAVVAQEPVERLVFASSSAIFGVSDAPLGEVNDRLPSPVSWYGKAKLASEYVLESLSAARPELAILTVRFPNVVGPLATHGVVFDFVRKLRSNPNALGVLGDGYQTKPYVHVTELLNGIQYFLDRLTPGVTQVNVGPPDLVSVRGIVEEVCGALDVNPKVTFQDSPFGWPGDVPHYEFDTSKMRREGFVIETTSRQAVRRAAEELAGEWSVR